MIVSSPRARSRRPPRRRLPSGCRRPRETRRRAVHGDENGRLALGRKAGRPLRRARRRRSARSSMSRRFPRRTLPALRSPPATPKPSKASNSVAEALRRSASPGRFDDGLGRAGARSALSAAAPSGGVRSRRTRRAGTTIRDLGPALGQRAGLVEDDGRDRVGRLQALSALDQDAVLGALARPDHDRRRRGQAQGAGAGDDHHGHEIEQGEGQGRRGPEVEPDARRSATAIADDHRHEARRR